MLGVRILFSVVMSVALIAVTVSAQETAFSYQGSLKDGVNLANGNYDFEFALYDVPAGGTPIGSTVTKGPVAVVGGIFNITLDFGNVFPGASRWLELRVRPTGGGAFNTLSPRQQIDSAPYSVKSLNTDTATTATNATQLGGLAANTYLQTNGNGSQLTNLNGANITNNTINASALQSDTFPNQRNLQLLGSLRWDLLGQRVAVGTNPRGVAFDGANIWVAYGSNSVTKLRVLDGAPQGTFAVGILPNGVTFDGANIWVANLGSNSVTKLQASDGAPQGTFGVGTNPRGVAFDGANIWVTNSNSNTVTKLRASDGALQGTFAVSTFPNGVAFDGANIWVANQNSNNVTKLRASDGACVATCTFAVGTSPRGVAFDGANIWVSNAISNNVTKLRAVDGALQGTFAVSGPEGVAFDGANIWLLNGGSNNVTKLRASDGALQDTFAVGTTPTGVAFDGANIWVTNQGSGNVIKLPVFP